MFTYNTHVQTDSDTDGLVLGALSSATLIFDNMFHTMKGITVSFPISLMWYCASKNVACLSTQLYVSHISINYNIETLKCE